jgi:hypothetical protein
MLEKLRMALLRRSLRQILATHSRQRKTHTIESARTIGILFDATEEKDRKEVLGLARSLEEERKKKVRLLGFVDSKQPLGQTQFPQFTQKEIRWNGIPASEAVDAFVDEKVDLLLCLNKLQVLPVMWVAIASKASMKIGTTTSIPHDFDMVLETPAEKGIRFFVDQLDLYLKKIIPSKHEPASAL